MIAKPQQLWNHDSTTERRLRMDEEIRAAAAAIPVLAGYTGPIERLGGLTNRVYRLGEVCMRLPGKGTEEYINRANEAVAARQAASAGVSPAVLHFDHVTGVLVTRFVAGAETMSPGRFKRPGAPARAARAFRKLHDSGAVFASRFELFAMIDDYLKVLSTKDVVLPAGYHDVVKEVNSSVRPALGTDTSSLAPCHCDPLCENFLDTGDRMWVDDWEYAGMNDPMWDLGDLSVEGSFDEGQDEEMMRSYFGRDPAPAERGRVAIFKAMCDLLWTLWGLIQLANANPADDFRRYADTRFTRCKTLMEGGEFGRHVAAVRR
jgi:thiamine kinase-like enzyme